MLNCLKQTQDIKKIRPKARKVIVFLITFLLLMSGCSMLKTKYDEIPPKIPGEGGGMAAYDWEVKSVGGGERSFTEFKGKVVFLNFWATWCAPCIAELPGLERMYHRLKNEGIVFAFVSDEEEPVVKKFLNDHKHTIPVYIIRAKPPEVFQTPGIPATFVVDKKGAIVLKVLRSAKWDDESVIAYLRKLTGSSAGGTDDGN